MRGLGGRDVAVRNHREHLSKIFARAQRRQVDSETLRRVDGSERRRLARSLIHPVQQGFEAIEPVAPEGAVKVSQTCR